MQIVRGLHNLSRHPVRCVATIGNFDGVHLGHQAVFQHLRLKAAALQQPTTVVIFEPQPMEFFAPDRAPPRLTRLREKLQVIEGAQIDYVVILEFNRRLASMDAELFIRRLLVEGLGVRYLLVGDDFRFGCGRMGDFGLLQGAGKAHNFDVESLDSFCVEQERVSSTRIRLSLAAGDLQGAARLLGRPYRIGGRVAHGDKRGRTIGFPTLNINLHRLATPLRGVFAVRVHGIGVHPLAGVANIGNRPTIQGDDRYLLEVHLFDFSRSIYGTHVQVEFCKWLRDEQQFRSVDALRSQIQRDTQLARDAFSG